MSQLTQRPTFSRDVSELFTPSHTVPGFVPGIGFGGVPVTMEGPPEIRTRTITSRGANPIMGAIADALTAIGGPRGWGSGIPIAAELQQRRQLLPLQELDIQEADIEKRNKLTLLKQELDRKRTEDELPRVEIDKENGQVIAVHPKRLRAGRPDAIEIIPMDGQDPAQGMQTIKQWEKEYGIEFTPDEVFALATAKTGKQRAATAQKILTERTKVKRDEEKERQAAERQQRAFENQQLLWQQRIEENRRAEEARMNRLLMTLNAANRPKEEDIAAVAAEVGEGRIPQERIPASVFPQVTKRVRDSGGVLMTRKQTEAMDKAGRLELVVEEIENVANRVNTGSSLVTPVTRAAGEVSAFMGFNEDAVKLKSARAQLGPIARGISQEVGVLTDRDIQRAEVAVPQVGESKTATKAKIEQLKTWIALTKQGIREQAGARPRKYEITTPDGAKTTRELKADEANRLIDGGAQVRILK